VTSGAGVARGVVLGDRYHLEQVIGQGGMATVYAARDRVLDRDVAIKLFPPVAEGDDDLLRHQAEMRMLAQLSHPNLVTLHDAGAAEAGGPLRQTYLVMELVQGPTLADRLQDGPLSPRHTARLGRQIAEALATVHASDVVHRDVKPANVLMVDREATTPDADDDAAAVTTGPIVKLADFGIARLGDGARLTMTGTTLGTATYLSPEQAAGGGIGPETDVYALGLVLLECLTGRKAFTGTVIEVAAARLNTSPAIPVGLGPEWVLLLTDMTRREADQRPTAADVARRLAVISGDAGSTGDVPVVAASVQGDHGSRASGADPAAATRDGAPAAGAASRVTRGLSSGDPLPASIPPRVPVAPARRRGEPGEPDGTQKLSSELIRAEAERSAQSPRERPAGATSTVPVDAALASGRRRRGGRRRWTLLLVAGLAVASAGTLVGAEVLGQDVGQAPSPAFPAVDGPSGDVLEDLERSVVR
jgi:eukaryotic-like serine/threonine-protein kinase